MYLGPWAFLCAISVGIDYVGQWLCYFGCDVSLDGVHSRDHADFSEFARNYDSQTEAYGFSIACAPQDPDLEKA